MNLLDTVSKHLSTSKASLSIIALFIFFISDNVSKTPRHDLARLFRFLIITNFLELFYDILPLLLTIRAQENAEKIIRK